MNIFDKIDAGCYENQLPYPKNKNTSEYEEYKANDMNLMTQFKSDLEKQFEVENNPKKDKVYYKAYERGHSAGLYEIAQVYSDLVELIK